METITIDALTGPAKEQRWHIIEKAIQSGKIVRFHYNNGQENLYYKDVNDLTREPSEPDSDHFDLKAFRQSGGRVPWVAWDSPWLTVEIVDE